MKTIVEKTFVPDVEHQRSLVAEAELDPTNNDEEQTWPTQEELEKAQTEQNQIKKRVPKGTSEYQAAWIVSDEEEEINEQNDFDDVDQHNQMNVNTDELESIQLDQQDNEEEEEMDEIVINKNNYDEKFDLEEDQQTFVSIRKLFGKMIFVLG